MFVLFCDIDGTITNKYTHSFEGSDEYIRKLISNGVTFILNSSKTFSEILQIQRELKILQPFIFENGSAIAIPEKSVLKFATEENHYKERNFLIFPLVPDRVNVSDWTELITDSYKNMFTTITSTD